MRIVVAFVAALLLGVFAHSAPTSAVGLKIAPQKYEAQLSEGEVKKGFIDISNPDPRPLTIQLDVQAFRQIDDDGSLEFFASEQLKAGVLLDFETMTLGPNESYRVYFLLDGTKLPSGDVFGAIFASTVPEAGQGSQQAIRVGTLLLLQNGTAPARTAEITDFSAPWLQISDGLQASMRIKNTADAGSATGFSPDIVIGRQPWGSDTVRGPLIFAQRTRGVEYSNQGNYIGPIWLKASVADAERGQLIFAVTGYWRWLAPVVIAVLTLLLFVYLRLKR